MNQIEKQNGSSGAGGCDDGICREENKKRQW
jgi:hypothetical protein